MRYKTGPKARYTGTYNGPEGFPFKFILESLFRNSFLEFDSMTSDDRLFQDYYFLLLELTNCLCMDRKRDPMR